MAKAGNGRKTHREAERRRRARRATVNAVGDQGSQLPLRASAQTKSAVLHCCAAVLVGNPQGSCSPTWIEPLEA